MSDLFPVPEEWKKRALMTEAQYDAAYAEAKRDPDGFWGKEAARLTGPSPSPRSRTSPGTRTICIIKWFEDGALNVAANCIDRHLAKRGDQTAIIWEGDDPQRFKAHHLSPASRGSLPLRQCAEGPRRQEGRPRHHLHADDPGSGLCHAGLRAASGRCIRWCSAASRPTAIAGRIIDCDSKIVITADEGLRGGKPIPLKKNTDEALAKAPASSPA